MLAKLVVASGKSAGRTISLKRNRLLIGRAEECDVRPLSEEVSRRHCAVTVGPSELWVEDLGSRNGTFVNGTRIEARTKLADGDMIRVGSLEVRVSLEPAAAAGSAADDVSRWLMNDEEAASTSDTTKTMTTAAIEPAAAPLETVSESSFVGGMDGSAAVAAGGSGSLAAETVAGETSRIDALKADRDKPGGLPKTGTRKADSSRDAAAEALKKFFDRK